MKNLLLSSILLFLTFNLYAQDNTTSKPLEDRKNEIRLNGLYLVAGAFEGSYSYILNEESTFGISLLFPIDSDVSEDINYYVSPYYRFFFGKKPAAGFFLEGFGMLNSTKQELFFGFDLENGQETVVDFALGIGLGGKFMTKRGLIGEVNLGVGRNLFNGRSEDLNNKIVAKTGISIGYRF